jgi:hypothetical protein
MATGCLRLIEYRTEDGSVFQLRVSPDVAQALKGGEGRLKEVTFTDLGDGRFELTEEHARKRPHAPRPKPGQWEGPRFQFSLYLGESRATWRGGQVIDERGRCGMCHDQRLPAHVYCLSCNRSGRELEIPGAAPKPKAKAHRRSDKLKGGLAGKR